MKIPAHVTLPLSWMGQGAQIESEFKIIFILFLNDNKKRVGEESIFVGRICLRHMLSVHVS